jgi:hypothetical protein
MDEFMEFYLLFQALSNEGPDTLLTIFSKEKDSGIMFILFGKQGLRLKAKMPVSSFGYVYCLNPYPLTLNDTGLVALTTTSSIFNQQSTIFN